MSKMMVRKYQGPYNIGINFELKVNMKESFN